MKQVKAVGNRIKGAAKEVTSPRNDGSGLVSKLKRAGNSNAGGASTGGSSAASVVSDEGGGDNKVVEEGTDAATVGTMLKNKLKTATEAVTEGAGNVVNKIQVVARNSSQNDDKTKDHHHDEEEEEEGTATKEKKFKMPRDDVLKKMITIGKQKIRGVSIQDYYEVAWSEGHDCDKEPVYGPFLTSCGKNNVKVQPWESKEEEGEGYKGEWCGETYDQQRIVTFDFMKKTIGETLVSVQHTQRCRRIDNDQCIVHMTLDMNGFPYSDCFVVEVRHVASRVGENDILVEIGLFVRFLKSCMFEGKIRTNTTAETTKLQMDLLALTIEGCAKIFLWPFIKLDLFDPFPPVTMDEAVTNVRRRVVLLEKMSKNDDVNDEQKDVLAKELKAIQASLKKIEAITTISS
ncbi:hypothetical protein ACHAWC_003206 [Mediolabrus comicus]